MEDNTPRYATQERSAHQVLSTILRHDTKQNSYKIALVRAINDVALAFPGLLTGNSGSIDVAVPLRVLAERWIAYYWPFVDTAQPILQGHRSSLNGIQRSDMSFRNALVALRREVEADWSKATVGCASDGFDFVGEMRSPRKRQALRPKVTQAYDTAVSAIMKALGQPIRYAGPKGQEYSVFAPPARYQSIATPCVALPGTEPSDLCLCVPGDLWRTFSALSLWMEALCVHEWCLFTERVTQEDEDQAHRGDIYRLLTDHPESRLPLTWESGEINLLLREGKAFVCPWTGRRIERPDEYHVDHLLPVAVYPVSELWNLVPCDPRFNSQDKRDRLPSPERLVQAEPRLASAYQLYDASSGLRRALREDVTLRFPADVSLTSSTGYSAGVAHAVTRFLGHVARSRNIAQF